MPPAKLLVPLCGQYASFSPLHLQLLCTISDISLEFGLSGIDIIKTCQNSYFYVLSIGSIYRTPSSREDILPEGSQPGKN